MSDIINDVLNYEYIIKNKILNMTEKEKLKRFEELKNSNKGLYDETITLLLLYRNDNDEELIDMYNMLRIKNENDYKVIVEILYLVESTIWTESDKYKDNLYSIGMLGAYSEMLMKINIVLKNIKKDFDN